MNFHAKVFDFLNLLDNALGIDQQEISFDYKGKKRTILLKSEVISKLCDKYNITYPFNISEEVSDIIDAFLIDQIDESKALSFIELTRSACWHYEFPNIPIEIDDVFKDKLSDLLVTDPVDSDEEKEKAELSIKHNYKSKREKVYKELIGSISPSKKISSIEKSTNLPDPYSLGFNYYNDTKTTIPFNQRKEVLDIISVMFEAYQFFKVNPDIKKLHGNCSSIIRACNHINVDKGSKRRWINYYACQAKKRDNYP